MLDIHVKGTGNNISFFIRFVYLGTSMEAATHCEVELIEIKGHNSSSMAITIWFRRRVY